MFVIKKITKYFDDDSEKDLKGLFIIQNIQIHKTY